MEPEIQNELKKLSQENNPFLLVLGSATTRNIEAISHELKKEGIKSGKVCIIDISQIPLKKHLETLKEDEFTSRAGTVFFLAQMDANKMGIRENQIDIIISDFTVNFNQTPENIKNMFNEMARVLKKEGAAFVSMNISSAETEKEPLLVERLKTKQFVFPLTFYKEEAEKAGFNFQIIKLLEHPRYGLQAYAKLTLRDAIRDENFQ
jgi:ubiquinone/menaquinone biosynthesis C-methylase UbiE